MKNDDVPLHISKRRLGFLQEKWSVRSATMTYIVNAHQEAAHGGIMY